MDDGCCLHPVFREKLKEWDMDTIRFWDKELTQRGWLICEREKALESLTYILSDDRAFEYADNFRFARVGNASEVREYLRIYSNGCCGYQDVTEFCHRYSDDGAFVETSAIMFGCNFGH